MRRWTLFAVGVAASLAVTALLWAVGVPGFFLFLAFPFLFFPLGRRNGPRDEPGSPARCGTCAAPRDPGHDFCPRCGSRFA